ncbi:hypothetical protein Tco_1063765 [Tanacetum coccineum]
MEAHCVNLELKYQNQALKEGKHGQFSKVKSNEAKVKHNIDVIETINIELEHKVAKLLKENETLKKHYKELYDSIKTTRARNIEHTTSLIAKNDEFKAQLQEKGFAIAALKNELRKLTGNSQRFASQVNVNNDLSKPVTTHYLPKDRESAIAKPHHMIAPGSSGYSSNDMEVNLHAKVPSHKTTTRYKPAEQTSVAKKQERQIPIGHRFSIKKTSIVHEKTITPRSCLRWKPTSKILKTVGLKWISTGKIFTSSTTKVDSEPTNGSNDDITNKYECEQTLDVSAGTLNLSAAMTSDHNSSELGIYDHNNELPKIVPVMRIGKHGKSITSVLEIYALSRNLCQGDSLNLPDYRYHKDGDSEIDSKLSRSDANYEACWSRDTDPKVAKTIKTEGLKI